MLQLAASLEKNSEHPLAEAIIEKAKQIQIEIPTCDEFIAISGRGIKGKINGQIYYGGNINLMQENNINIGKITSISEKLSKEGKTVLYFANEKQILGLIAVADTIKNTSYKAIEELKKKNIEVVMLTGDNSIVANTIGNK